MSITDELRGWMKGSTLSSWTAEHLLAIADRIDAEHEEAIQQVLMGEGGVPATDENIAKQGWIRLPRDADEVPWNVGDRDEDGNVVIELRLTASGWYVLTDGERVYRPERRSHYHAPTVEDVLTEFGIDWEHESDCEDRAALLKEYAAKLRLAEGEDA